MSLVKTNNVHFPALFNDFFGPDWFGGSERNRSYVPAVNIRESDQGFELELAVPGGKKEDFSIDVNEGVLTIAVENESSTETQEEGYTRKEFSFHAFKRAFTLPESVDEDAIKASYEAGILRFELPKKEEALPKPKRTITIG